MFRLPALLFTWAENRLWQSPALETEHSSPKPSCSSEVTQLWLLEEETRVDHTWQSSDLTKYSLQHSALIFISHFQEFLAPNMNLPASGVLSCYELHSQWWHWQERRAQIRATGSLNQTPPSFLNSEISQWVRQEVPDEGGRRVQMQIAWQSIL